jgi:hypothetical protein
LPRILAGGRPLRIEVGLSRFAGELKQPLAKGVGATADANQNQMGTSERGILAVRF